MIEVNETTDLSWPWFSATQKKLAEILEKKGFTVTHEGRSGFQSRNRFVISTPDNCLSQENVEKANLGIQESKEILTKEKQDSFDKYFDECSTDPNKCYAVVETGYNYYLTRIPSAHYAKIESTVLCFTQDSRQGIEHTYATLMINEERMKKDPRSSITFAVPKKMIGHIIGKGGSRIKELQDRYKKRFKVVQEPKEIINEKKEAIKSTLQELLKEQDFDQIRKHMGEIVNLESMFSIADKKEMIAAVEDGIAREKELIQEREHRARVTQIYGLTDKIAENIGSDYLLLDRAALDRQTDNYIKENKEAEELHLKPEEIIRLQENLSEKRDNEKNTIEHACKSYLDENAENKADDEIKDGLKEHMSHVLTVADMSRLLPAALKIGEEQLALKRKEEYERQQELERQQKLEAEKQKRIEAVDKKFDKVVSGELDRFYNDPNNRHGADFFSSVGKQRRSTAKDAIILSTLRKLDPEHYKEDFYDVYTFGTTEDLVLKRGNNFETRLDDIINGADESEVEAFIVQEAEPTEIADDLDIKPQTKEDLKKARQDSKHGKGENLSQDLLALLKDKYNGR